MKLSSTLNLLLAGAALLASTPGADAAERKLRGNHRHLQDTAGDDMPQPTPRPSNKRPTYSIGYNGPPLDEFTNVPTAMPTANTEPVHWIIYDTPAPTEPSWEPGTHCGAGTTCKNCKDGYYEFWYSWGFTACGVEPDWEDGTRCAAGTTCNACKDGYYEYWDSLAFTACGREPCWEDGAYCAAGTTCNECCNSYHYNTRWAWTLCGESY